MRVITLTKVRALDLVPSVEGIQRHVSAASGLVRAGSFLYVVMDDDLELGVFRAGDNEPGRTIRLFEGELPPFNPERKRQKPDLEALVLLPAFENFPNGALLALGSGSRPNRRRSVLIAVDAQGAVHGAPKILDLSPLYDPLAGAFAALNIEGAVIVGNQLCLFQRGNRRNSANAIARFPLSPVLDAVNGGCSGAIKPLAIHTVDLGGIDGVPFTFSDAAALPDGRMVFTAIAEDTDNTYDDGPCAAAAIGVVDGDGRLRSLFRLDAPYKVEGIDARVDGDALRLLLVTDADEPTIPAILYSATLEC
jgi:hypothetical protein